MKYKSPFKKKKESPVKIWYIIGFVSDKGEVKLVFGPYMDEKRALKLKGEKGFKLAKLHIYKGKLQRQEILYTWKKKWKKVNEEQKTPKLHCPVCGDKLKGDYLGTVVCKCTANLIIHLNSNFENAIAYEKNKKEKKLARENSRTNYNKRKPRKPYHDRFS